MFKCFLSAFLLLSLLLAAPIVSPAQTPDSQQPLEVDDNFLQNIGAAPQFGIEAEKTAMSMSEAAKLAQQQNRVLSVPTFNKSFVFQGKTFPFTMVGKAPERGETTRVETQLIPISMFFEGFVDKQGNPIILDVTPLIDPFRNSPNFRRATYRSGFTQFGDAIQRAEFFHAMELDWHTLINEPKQLPAVTLDVPKGAANLFRSRSTGQVFAVIDTGFFISQLNTIIQLEHLEVDALPIALTNNVFLSPGANVKKCCILGFHTAFDAGERGNTQLVQTFAWASWIGTGIFGGNIGDVTALSHEIVEWLNDPFGNNSVPPWQFPNGAGGCDDTLETGDPLEVFANSAFPVPINGVTFHPQNEALLQWFERPSTSDAVDGAFSFPDETLLPGPSQACAPQPQ
ncbi:MAG TPA: hypothetical protein VG759_10835 [Candidatus Angelobacter sp.]|jgi:hypothetical protein|nr:hypothetical protein [Candidatus Angelobacter sp.]